MNPFFLPLPERQESAMRRDDMIHLLESMSLRDREMWIHREFMNGNVPDSSRRLVPIVLRNLQENGSGVELTLWVTADYLSLGSDDESLLMPMTPLLAQRLANMLGCSLPTPRMVDSIWEAAELKLAPQPIPPGEKMVTIQVFAQHDQMIKSQLAGRFPGPEKNRLIAGHKKDVVIIPELDSLKNKVVIYGWHQLSGLPIQPVYSGHIIWYADYSHGIRLVWNTCLMNGKSTSLECILKNAHLGSALSKAARPMTQTAYPTDPELYPEPGSPE
ncbi:MAG: hypothetical protein LR011_09085 [Verrucomicrobia bacterium]|nr:hypothetical protein [Verrucomicrobiota bacterium]